MKNEKFSLKEFIKSGAVMLTPANVQDVLGKEIEWSHECYSENRPTLYKGTIIEIKKDRLVMQVVAGKPKARYEVPEGTVYTHEFIFLSKYFDEAMPFYACSDADRPVYFKLAK